MAGISKANEGRISLALRPTTARALRQLSFLADKSVNDFIAQILEGVVRRNDKTLAEFQAAESKAKSAVRADIAENSD